MTKETFDFFEVKEVINCSELLDHSAQGSGEADDPQGSSRIMRALGNFFTLQTESAHKSADALKMSAMCATRDILAIGFSNGVLILFNS